MNEEKLQDATAMGERAQLILNEPLIASFFSSTEETIISGIKTSQFDDKEGREKLYQLYKLLLSFKQFFERYVADGKISSDMLEKIKSGAFDNM